MESETVTVFRGQSDKYGNNPRASAGTIGGVIFAWGSHGSSTGRYADASGIKGESNNLTAQIFVPRGTDLRDKDRLLRENGDNFRIIGRASWDQDFPFDGTDFGWVVYQVEAM